MTRLKDWWRGLPDWAKWTIGVLLVPGVFVAAPLVLVCYPIVMIAAAVMDGIDEWSAK